jgi:hypothetical protein
MTFFFLTCRWQATKQQKFCPNEPGGRARLFFSFLFILFYLFISFILLIQFNFVTYVLKTPAHDEESTAGSRRARSHGLTGPLSVRLCNTKQPGQHATTKAPYLLARTGTISTDAPRPQACSRQVSKKVKKIKQTQKNERKSLWTLAVTSQCRIFGSPPGDPVLHSRHVAPRNSPASQGFLHTRGI